ncbi:signal transduction histidine kinase [Candidatus Magnetoovum chiemensis]|nr:signal transduction histidine kinase [Candidatus Magnetoovum chiemensis]
MEDNEKADFSDILANSVHDMKNSLNMHLTLITDIMETTEDKTSQPFKTLAKLHYETKRIVNNLIQLLSIYSIEQKHYPINITYNSVPEFLEDIILHNQLLLEYKGIKVETKCPEDLFWFFDQDLIACVLNSIINNAYKYAKDRLQIAAEIEQNNCLKISIEDNGEGYPNNMLTNNIDEIKGVSYNSGSTGLGLYFSSIVAKMHKNKNIKGTISIENGKELGGGCFTIILP